MVCGPGKHVMYRVGTELVEFVNELRGGGGVDVNELGESLATSSVPTVPDSAFNIRTT